MYNAQTRQEDTRKPRIVRRVVVLGDPPTFTSTISQTMTWREIFSMPVTVRDT